MAQAVNLFLCRDPRQSGLQLAVAGLLHPRSERTAFPVERGSDPACIVG